MFQGMEFRFNFNSDDVSSSDNVVSVPDNHAAEVEYKEDVSAFTEILCDNAVPDQSYKICHLKVGDNQLAYISTEELHKSIKDTEDNKRIALAVKNHSDLLPGVYEGGLKVWECSLDLVHYLAKCNVFREGMKVFEIGCGAGLVGIYAYLKGANVDFQDYNEEVLRLLTINNVLLNTDNQGASEVSNHCRFFAGDWEAVNKSFSSLSPVQHKYDIIVTSETIYNPNNQVKLLDLMKNTLKPKGKIYIAAKSYYFGVGGSIQQFEELVNSDNTFGITLCMEIYGEIPRKILSLRLKKDFESMK